MSRPPVSVIVPTRNAGPALNRLVATLRSQRGVPDPELIAVDAGSSDGTPAAARRLGCRVAHVPAGPEAPSAARNLGVSLAAAPRVLLMTQDARPDGPRWLASLLDALEHRRAAAVSCLERPAQDCDLYYRFLVEAHQRNLDLQGRDRVIVLEPGTPPELARKPALSAVTLLSPREILRRYPLRGVFGSDMDLGQRLLEAGHRLALLSSVRVIRSHNRPPSFYLRHFFLNTRFLADSFGDIPPLRDTTAAEALSSAACILDAAQRSGERVAARREPVRAGALWDVMRSEFAFEFLAARALPRRRVLADPGLERLIGGFARGPHRPIRAEHLAELTTPNWKAFCSSLRPPGRRVGPRELPGVADLMLKTAAQTCGLYLARLTLTKLPDADARLAAKLETAIVRGEPS